MFPYRYLCLCVASFPVAVLATAACDSNDAFLHNRLGSPSGPPDAATDGLAANGLVDGSAEGSSSDDAEPPGESGIGSDDVSSSGQALVRIANWVPDAPATGFDLCLSRAGTGQWIGPLLQLAFPRGSLGQGGANGLQFTSVSAYFPVPPDLYDAQLVKAGASDCMIGLIPTTVNIPSFTDTTYATLAIIGDVQPAGSDPGMQIAVFFDDPMISGDRTALRAINAVPSMEFLDVGTGSVHSGNYSALLPNIPFGTAARALADNTSTDSNGYATIGPVSNGQFSAHPTGQAMADTSTATRVTLAAGAVTTMALINGQTGGRPPQFLVCADNGHPLGAQSPCKVIPQ
jgi:hypothetical protein